MLLRKLHSPVMHHEQSNTSPEIIFSEGDADRQLNDRLQLNKGNYITSLAFSHIILLVSCIKLFNDLFLKRIISLPSLQWVTASAPTQTPSRPCWRPAARGTRAAPHALCSPQSHAHAVTSTITCTLLPCLPPSFQQPESRSAANTTPHTALYLRPVPPAPSPERQAVLAVQAPQPHKACSPLLPHSTTCSSSVWWFPLLTT